MPAISDSTRLVLGLVVAVCVLILLPIVYDIAKGDIKFIPNQPVVRWLLFAFVGTLAVIGTVLASAAPSSEVAQVTPTEESAPTATDLPPTLTATDIPSPTVEPTANEASGPTPTSTPAPTNSPNTLPGTELGVGDGFRHDNILMTVADINLQADDDCSIGIRFRIDNLSSAVASLTLRDIGFTLTDNLSRKWQRTGLSTESVCPASGTGEEYSETLEVGKKYPVAGGYYSMGFLGPIDEPAVQYVIFEVTEMAGFTGAQWRIPLDN